MKIEASELSGSGCPIPRKTMSVPEAGRVYFGLGKNASYAAAHAQQIPVIRIGHLLRVPIIALERMLEAVGK